MTATFVVILLGVEDRTAPRPSWAILLGAWLGVAWAGVFLQVQGGTAEYDAVPVAALTTPVMVLLAVSAVVASGLYPWRAWPTRLWLRPSLRDAGIAAILLPPLGLYLLVRAYEMGDGRYPQTLINIALATWGVLVALGAAVRGQAAATRRDYLAETLPGLAGFALMSVAVGSSLGVVAAVILLASIAIAGACLPLLPDRGGAASLLVTASAAGVPPSLAFGGRLLGLDAAFESATEHLPVAACEASEQGRGERLVRRCGDDVDVSGDNVPIHHRTRQGRPAAHMIRAINGADREGAAEDDSQKYAHDFFPSYFHQR